MYVQANCLSGSHNNKDKFGWVKINIGEWFVIRQIRQSFPYQNFVLYSILIGDYKQQLQARLTQVAQGYHNYS